MQVPLPRVRWKWLLVACLAAAVAVIGWWQLSVRPSGRFTREQYDRIRLGMTPAEVSEIIGAWASSPNKKVYAMEQVESESAAELPPYVNVPWRRWYDGDAEISIWYQDGKVAHKELNRLILYWEMKIGEWRQRLSFHP
jgi:hypothetical protein